MHTQTSHDSRVPSAFWWIVAACVLAYSWQHLAAQTAPATPSQPAVNTAELSNLLTKVDGTSQSAAVDIARLRVEKWKADSPDKQQLQTDADSIQRNLTAALPGMTTAVRSAPQDLAANFKLYRNLNALYDVMKTLTEASAAFGPKQDYETLAHYADAIDGYRRNLGDYMETLAASKEAELARFRSQPKVVQNTTPAKKVIIDDNAPEPKKSTKKKTSKTTSQSPNQQ